MHIKFIRFDENVQMPKRAHNSDTGLDFYLLKDTYLIPHEPKIINLGFGIEVPNGYTARLQVRTSLAKLGVHIEQCAIDAGYTGELHAIVTNLSNYIVQFKKGDRIGYIEVYPCVYPILVEGDENKRGDSWCGSTGRK